MAGHATPGRPIRMAAECGRPMAACAQSGESARGNQEFSAPLAALAFPATALRAVAQAVCSYASPPLG